MGSLQLLNGMADAFPLGMVQITTALDDTATLHALVRVLQSYAVTIRSVDLTMHPRGPPSLAGATPRFPEAPARPSACDRCCRPRRPCVRRTTWH